MSETWWLARRGVPTASAFDKIITPKKREYSKSARAYMYELIAERTDLNPPWLSNQGSPYRSTAMQNGVNTEPEARGWYEMYSGLRCDQVGFCLSDDLRFGCSPDSLVEDEGLLELKCPLLKTQAEYLDAGKIPDDYLPQVHGQLIVTGRKWVDFVSYAPGLPALIQRVVPDSFTDALRVHLETFWKEYQDLVQKLAPKES